MEVCDKAKFKLILQVAKYFFKSDGFANRIFCKENSKVHTIAKCMQ